MGLEVTAQPDPKRSVREGKGWSPTFTGNIRDWEGGSGDHTDLGHLAPDSRLFRDLSSLSGAQDPDPDPSEVRNGLTPEVSGGAQSLLGG